MTTTSIRPASSLRSPSHHHTNNRDRFARTARNRAFRARDLSLARQPGFVDRQPEDPVRLGVVVDPVVDDLGQRALRHWIKQAADAEGEEREAALEIAREIAGMIGVPWADVMSEAA